MFHYVLPKILDSIQSLLTMNWMAMESKDSPSLAFVRQLLMKVELEQVVAVVVVVVEAAVAAAVVETVDVAAAADVVEVVVVAAAVVEVVVAEEFDVEVVEVLDVDE